MITRRGWTVIGGGLGGLLVGFVTLDFLILLGAVVLFSFLVADLLGFHLSVPRLRPEQFSVDRREVQHRVTIGREISDELLVTYLGNGAFWGECFDVVPGRADLVSGRPSATHYWTHGESVRLSYRLRLAERGRQTLGPVVVLAVGPLGLAFERLVLPHEAPFLSVPSEMRWPPRPGGTALSNPVRGPLHLRRRGYGSEVHSLRPYQGQDDIRHVAWFRSTPEELIVSEHRQESRQDYLLVFDLSAGMGAGPPGRSALDIAVEAGYALVRMVERIGEDRIGLLAGTDTATDFLPAGRGTVHLARLEERLALLTPRAESFDLGTQLLELVPRLRAHTHVFVFSEAREVSPRLAVAHRHLLGKGHRLYLLLPEVARLYPPGWGAVAPASVRWAARRELHELHERLTVLKAAGLRFSRYDSTNARPRLLRAYAELRAWGRAG